MKNKTKEPTLVTIEKDWSYKKKKFFELENLIRQSEAVEENLITVLQQNRKVMQSLNAQRLEFIPISLEPTDLIQERIIKLPGIKKEDHWV